MLLLHNRVNFFWGRLAPSHSLWGSAAAQSCECSWVRLAPSRCSVNPTPPEHQKRSKLQSLGSEVLGNTVASEIKLKKEVSSGNLTAKSHTV